MTSHKLNSEIVDEMVEKLQLSPHPEGGFFREIYRSEEQVECRNGKLRSAGTGIYFLLSAGVSTHWHRVQNDESWHFYKGNKLMLEIIGRKGNFHQKILHNDFQGGGSFQKLVPENCWQRAYSTGPYSLVGCSVTPGFEFEDFEMIESAELAELMLIRKVNRGI